MDDEGAMMQHSQGDGGSWAAFLAASFVIVGLAGLFASYAAPLPYQRELRVLAVLDALPDTPPGQREALRPALGDSADAVLTGDGPIAPRIDAERTRLRARFAHEADYTATRLRLIIIVVTAMATAFGVVILRLQRRA